MFTKNIWSLEDIYLLERFLESIKNEERVEWTKKIVNTNLPVLAIKLNKIREIAKEIKKGEYYSFLDIMPNSSFEILTLSGYLISEIKDFETQKKYLKKYALKCDNWSNCDSLAFKIKNNERNYFILAKNLTRSQNKFTRRIGIDILFSLLKNDKYLTKIFKLLDSLSDEKEYYVNMCISWLLCEMFIKYRDETIIYFNNNNLNSFVINKAVQKCRDSYRVTDSDKKMLLQYKK